MRQHFLNSIYAKSLIRLLSQHSNDKISRFRRNRKPMLLSIWELRLFSTNQLEHFPLAFVVKRREPNKHLVSHDPKSPPVHHSVMPTFIQNLWSKVFRGSTESLSELNVAHVLAQSKIS